MKRGYFIVACATVAAGQFATSAMANGPTAVVEDPPVVVDAMQPTGNLYLRGAVGRARAQTDDAYWEPPGFPADPRVFFDLDIEDTGFGEVALGYDWNNGFRADLAFAGFGESDFDGPWARTDPATPGPHADVSGSIKSRVLMVNGYFEPLTYTGQTHRFQPFVTGGIGMARNEMSDWTRTNAAAGRVTRTFEGDTTTGFAWSLGFGVTAELSVGRQPMFLEAGYRYFDLGSAEGSATPRPGNGVGSPATPLQFDHREHVISVGLRVPLGKF